jgi:DNA polymerase III subunit alpha
VTRTLSAPAHPEPPAADPADGAYVNLHTHTEYSLLDGACKVEDAVERAASLGQPALALTDHGVLYGAIEFYRAARKAGITPILGMEAYVARRSRFDRDKEDRDPYHLVLLAADDQGWRNLVKLSSRGHTEGFYQRPRIDKELLGQCGTGLICLSGCLGGELAQTILREGVSAGERVARGHLEIFGPTHYFLELQDHDDDEQRRVNDALLTIARRAGLELVATNDAHYLTPADAEMHEVLLAMGTQGKWSDPNRFRFPGSGYHLPTAAEMRTRFAFAPSAVANSVAIARRVSLELTLDQPVIPQFAAVPDGTTPQDYLRTLCQQGLLRRYGDPLPAAVLARMDHELEVIHDQGFDSYFLTVWDYVQTARCHGVRVGPGRGSAAGSIVSYGLGITNLDPLKHGLLFERFLNSERRSLPDIDVDFDDRDAVIRLVRERYGTDRVAQIVAFQSMGARAALRDVGRTLEMPAALVDRVVDLLPSRSDVALDDALREVEELRHLAAIDARARRLFEVARQLEGLKKADSRHAAGVVISTVPLEEVVPVQRAKSGEGLVTQFDDGSVEQIGLLKMDCLGLTNLQTIGACVDLIEATSGVRVDVERVPDDDPATFEVFARGDMVGIFQMEGAGARRILMEMRPTSISDLAVATALNRPGPIQSGVVDMYMRRRRGTEPIDVPLPQMTDALADSYGLIVYQEQVMQVAASVAGYSPGEADILRAAMGKKDTAKMTAQHEKFVAGALANGVDEQTTTGVFDTIAQFASYGFNRAHAVAYAHVAYQTAYLKTNHPLEFVTALLNTVPHERYARVIADAEKCGLHVLAPEVNASDARFSVAVGTRDAIIFGLGTVKGVSVAAAERLVVERRRAGPFVSLEDLCARARGSGLTRTMVGALVKAGACDALGERAYLLAKLDRIPRDVRRQKPVMPSLFGPLAIDRAADVPPADETERLGWERELLGVYRTGHPLAGVRDLLLARVPHTTAELSELLGEDVVIAGLVTDIEERVPKSSANGQRMAVVTLEDLSGTARVIFFARRWAAHGEQVHRDAIVAIRGRVEIDRFAARRQPDRSERDGEIDGLHGPALQILADDAFTLDSDRFNEFASARRLRLDIEPADVEKLAPLRSILTAFPGDTEVEIQVFGPDRVDSVLLGERFRVDADAPLVELLGELLHPSRVRLRVALEAEAADRRAPASSPPASDFGSGRGSVRGSPPRVASSRPALEASLERDAGHGSRTLA